MLFRSRKDDSFDVVCQFGHMIVRMDFAINEQFTQSARNQLGVLRTKVENEDFFSHESTTKVLKFPLSLVRKPMDLG